MKSTLSAVLLAAMFATPAAADCNTGAAIRAKHRAPVLNCLPGNCEGSPAFFATEGSTVCVDDGATAAYGPFLHGEWIAVVFQGSGLARHQTGFVKETDWERVP